MIPIPSSSILSLYSITTFPSNFICLYLFSLNPPSSLSAAHIWMGTGSTQWNQLPISSKLGWESRAPLPFMLGIWLAASCSGLVHAVKVSYLFLMCNGCHVQQILFFWRYPQSLTIMIILKYFKIAKKNVPWS